jgi:hypothetical protein
VHVRYTIGFNFSERVFIPDWHNRASRSHDSQTMHASLLGSWLTAGSTPQHTIGKLVKRALQWTIISRCSLVNTSTAYGAHRRRAANTPTIFKWTFIQIIQSREVKHRRLIFAIQELPVPPKHTVLKHIANHWFALHERLIWTWSLCESLMLFYGPK